MTTYIIRRLLWLLPILLMVNLLTFVLFFVVNSPDDMARAQLGNKHVTDAAIAAWKAARGYDLPLLWNTSASGWESITQTIFWQKSLQLMVFNFGVSDAGRAIGADMSQRAIPSLMLALPTFVLGLLVNIVLALVLVMFRGQWLDKAGLVFTVVLMSVSGLFFIIGGQYVFAKLWHWFPISGYEPDADMWRFLLLPVILGVIAGVGSGVRWYRSILLEEADKDFTRTARAKGLSQWQVMRRHVLPNGMLPILTGVVAVLPLLFMGSLLMESFFGIPGLGSYTIDAINSQDFAIVRAMVYLGAVLYVVGLLLTDLAYAAADPRVRLGDS
jgi:peptide/nickel transport system permease protein